MSAFILSLFLTAKLLHESGMAPFVIVAGGYLTIANTESPILDVV